MANFNASLRTSYRDISGMVMSCARNDIVEDTLNPGFVKGWRNRAMGIPSQPMVRLQNVVPTYLGGRYPNPGQTNIARQPELEIGIGGIRRVKFNKADQQYLSGVIPATHPMPDIARPVTIAMQFEPGADATGTQVVYDDGVETKLSRLNAGVAEFLIGTTPVPIGTDLLAGRWLIRSNASNLISWSRDRTLSVDSDPGASATTQVSNTTIYLGRSVAGDYLDGILDSFHIWARELSPLERDLVWNTIDEDGADFAEQTRAPVAMKVWTDSTGAPGTNQIVRVRSPVAVNQYFKMVTVSGGVPKRVQIAASENGLVKPDSELSETFNIRWIEAPGSPPVPPVVSQDVGWSSVFDCSVSRPGHYCAQVWRPFGGAVNIHFDVEFV